MADFFRDFFRLIGRYRRGLFLAAFAVVLMGVIGIGVSYKLSTQTSFCGSCHYEEPYVASWEESSHADVDCHVCHVPAGFGGKVNRGIDAAWNGFTYMLGIHDPVPRAEIDDASCLQSGCHETQLLSGPIEYEHGILFDHAAHFGGNIRGLELRCTSCHSQIVQGSHMEVTPETCFLCHFKNLPRGEAIAGCSCHGPPENVVVHEGFRFRHDQYLTLGVVCEECHVNVTSGDGEVPPATCVQCHTARLDAVDDVRFMHRKHVGEHDIDCAECHEPVGHSDLKLVRSLETSCSECHSGSHDAARDMFMGIGAEGVEPYPSIMFKAQVGCEGCHRDETAAQGLSGNVKTTAGEGCVICHGRGFDTMLDDWSHTVDNYMKDIDWLLAKTRAAYRSANSESRARAQDLMNRSEKNVTFLKTGHGEHNLVYAKLILLRLQDDLNDALELLDPALGRFEAIDLREDDLRGNCTRSCHANMRETKLVQFEGLELTHRDHVYDHNLECTYCHDNTAEHGEIRLDRKSCLGCHHNQESVDCINCHRTQTRMVLGEGMPGVEDTPGIMSDLDCIDCHVSMEHGHDRAGVIETCVDCHEEGYEEYVVDWQTEADERLVTLEALVDSLAPLFVTASSRGVPGEVVRGGEKLKNQAISEIALVRDDRSRGVHNYDFMDTLLESAEEKLREAANLLTR